MTRPCEAVKIQKCPYVGCEGQLIEIQDGVSEMADYTGVDCNKVCLTGVCKDCYRTFELHYQFAIDSRPKSA